jgi:hypothetical protein
MDPQNVAVLQGRNKPGRLKLPKRLHGTASSEKDWQIAARERSGF